MHIVSTIRQRLKKTFQPGRIIAADTPGLEILAQSRVVYAPVVSQGAVIVGGWINDRAGIDKTVWIEQRAEPKQGIPSEMRINIRNKGRLLINERKVVYKE